MSLGFLQTFVANQGDAWAFTLDQLGSFYERAMASDAEPDPVTSTTEALLREAASELPVAVGELIGPYLQSAELLGQRTAELHLALAAGAAKPDFAPEPLSALYLRSLYQSMRGQTTQAFQLLRRRLDGLPAEARERASAVLARQGDVERRFDAIRSGKIDAVRIRTHGDYHLGQVLYTGSDFVIIDFEGEPARPLGERRLKRSPLRDVAGMLRSYHYAAWSGLFDQVQREVLGTEEETTATLEPWARAWTPWTSAAFLGAYLEAAQGASFLPAGPEELRTLLDAHLLEKAIYELGYELNNRPGWVRIPLQGISQLLDV
jgi:maltose alpha-D-glucosyltransferase/alpha-amylase